MDSKNFNQRLANALNDDPAVVSTLVDAFANVLTTAARNLDTVAIPSFGSFQTVKVDETVVTDRTTGRKLLLPPTITVKFQPANSLRKKISQS